MIPEEGSSLSYTVEHFKEVARQNRFAENRYVAHETNRCLVCHPELCLNDPFEVYLRVVAEAVKVRRPRLDQGLIDELNRDLELIGDSFRISCKNLLEDDPKALHYWSEWVREALNTGLSLLSVHSTTSVEFTLEEAEALGWGQWIEAVVNEIIDYQKQET